MSDSTPSSTALRFPSGDEECAAVFVRPQGSGLSPCVVLGHGFAALKEGGPIRSAERYAAEGYAGLAFDYRYFGESTGEPRQLLDIEKQLADWRAAIAFARELEGVDPDRIILWGSSFSGGHVMKIAAEDHRVAAVISQSPHVSGLATLRHLGVAHNLTLARATLRDLASRLAGRGPRRIPIVGPPGTTAAMATPDAEPGYRGLYEEGFEWRTDFVPRVMLHLPFYNPGRRAPDIACPLLVQVTSEDRITPPGPAMDAARAAPRGDFELYAGAGHFDIYRGEVLERVLRDQLSFLNRSVPA